MIWLAVGLAIAACAARVWRGCVAVHADLCNVTAFERAIGRPSKSVHGVAPTAAHLS